MKNFFTRIGHPISVGCFIALSTFTGLPTVLASEDGANLIEEVVVTARRREEVAQDVPIPITALNQEQLIARNITEIRDIAVSYTHLTLPTICSV